MDAVTDASTGSGPRSARLWATWTACATGTPSAASAGSTARATRTVAKVGSGTSRSSSHTSAGSPATAPTLSAYSITSRSP